MPIQINTSARLHFGLLDLSAATQRVDGGVGLSISDPAVIVSVDHHPELKIEAPDEFVSICRRVLSLLLPLLRHSNLSLRLETNIIRHCGFGSGTQTALAVGLALLQFAGRRHISVSELAVALHRGGTSGVGVYAFSEGGLLVDGGRAWPHEKAGLGPSSDFELGNIPPCIARLNFPDWGICVVIPNNMRRLHGNEERQAFREFTPIPVDEVAHACRIVLTGILPTVATSDFDGFCESVEGLRGVGMKRREWSLMGSMANEWDGTLKRLGFRGVSTSSWGPLIFAFAPSVQEAQERAGPLYSDNSVERLFVTTANNKGYRVRDNESILRYV